MVALHLCAQDEGSIPFDPGDSPTRVGCCAVKRIDLESG
jgi:hypothetical protein